VALLHPDELFSQADLLVSYPNEVDFRRAISAAYYGLFHAILTAAADQAVGFEFRAHRIYSYVYRNISHASLRELCDAIKKPALPPKFKPFEPQGGFDMNCSPSLDHPAWFFPGLFDQGGPRAADR
jgi:hypothetical protein